MTKTPACSTEDRQPRQGSTDSSIAPRLGWRARWNNRLAHNDPLWIAFLLGLIAVCTMTPSMAAAQDPPADVMVEDTASAESTPDGSQVPRERIAMHLPDPEGYRAMAMAALERAEQADDKTLAGNLASVIGRIDSIQRPHQIHLTREDALLRALANSFAIEVASYNPAVETTRVVEAEAAFDAVFFGSANRSKDDRQTASQLFAGDSDTFNSSIGVRKRLPTGMQISGAWTLERQKTTLSFQQLNPAYTSNFVLELRQPLLRGFGIDVNRAQIVVAQHNRRAGELAFHRQVRDTLRQVDESYWRLVEARRDIVISARVLADFEQIYKLLKQRSWDTLPAQLAATKANLENSRADFVRRRTALFDAEDRLISVMNDPTLNLADDIEIVTDDFPRLSRRSVDRLGEARIALDNRPEIKEQELVVSTRRIEAGVAKNAKLPLLDFTFRETINGLSGNADRAFDEMSRNRFVSYFFGVELEVPIGNRAPRAAHHRAQLQYAQSAAQLRSVFEQVLVDVNVSVRKLETAYDLIAPSFESAEARDHELKTTVARKERLDYATLNTELGARQSLASSRRAMLNAMVEYNIALMDLERAKGTLLQHCNVTLAGQDD